MRFPSRISRQICAQAAFTEDVDTLRLGPDGWQLADSRRKVAHEVLWS